MALHCHDEKWQSLPLALHPCSCAPQNISAKDKRLREMGLGTIFNLMQAEIWSVTKHLVKIQTNHALVLFSFETRVC